MVRPGKAGTFRFWKGRATEQGLSAKMPPCFSLSGLLSKTHGPGESKEGNDQKISSVAGFARITDLQTEAFPVSQGFHPDPPPSHKVCPKREDPQNAQRKCASREAVLGPLPPQPRS